MASPADMLVDEEATPSSGFGLLDLLPYDMLLAVLTHVELTPIDICRLEQCSTAFQASRAGFHWLRTQVPTTTPVSTSSAWRVISPPTVYSK